MDALHNIPHGGSSDYGSDLSLDEEDELTKILLQIGDISQPQPDLVLKDSQDDENPRGAKVPHKLGRERNRYLESPVLPDSAASESRVSIEIDCHCELTPKIVLTELIDDQASSEKSRKSQ